MKNINNPIYHELKKLKLILDKNLIKINNKTRDKKISVIKDKKTEIIFLEKHITDGNYYNLVEYSKVIKKNANLEVFIKSSNKTIKSYKLEDDIRRAKLFNTFCKNKEVLDFGCGWGGFLSNIKKAKSYSAVELRKECISYIKKNKKKIKISDDINLLKNKFDLITMFHVLEHIPYQIETLKLLHSKLRKNGKIIIEVPHAKDFLILQDELKEFKNFTFWSEHLILHTVQSLKKVLTKSGFKKIRINYFQRYNFSNHLGWFISRKPGGHNFYKKFNNKKLNSAYVKNLVRLGQTDTLIAVAQK
jgi:2-polyprenyl-3-methyl-5-hydroxy-6-metoxy-1,4-benzoquinol methylase